MKLGGTAYVHCVVSGQTRQRNNMMIAAPVKTSLSLPAVKLLNG